MSNQYDKMPTVKISPEAKKWIDNVRGLIPISKFLNVLFKELSNYDVAIMNDKVSLEKLEDK